MSAECFHLYALSSDKHKKNEFIKMSLRSTRHKMM